MITLKGNARDNTVVMEGHLLSPTKSQKAYNHSPDGFSWGYSGSGPAQLALAILLELMPKEKALAKYQDFKFKVIANIPQDSDFTLVMTNKLKVVKLLVTKNIAKTIKNTDIDIANCSIGHGIRCQQAKSNECKCSCGGKNHGKQNSLF